ncbi:MAG TPA: hypothetical protein VKZ18_01740 [Polyangia bacterium]|nr:hypothetical protein [Polyangia bacterium]
MRDERSLDEKLAPREFVNDFVWAGRAVFSQPSLVLLSVALWCIPAAIRFATTSILARTGAYLVCGVLGLGWYGAERVFFLRRREGKPVTFGDLLESAPNFLGRFLSLGILVGVVVAPLNASVSALAVRKMGPAGLHAARVEALVVFVAVDFLLTFATPALVFSTRSVRQALRIGVSMIRQTWPRSGLYVLCPPLALSMLNVVYPTELPVVRLVSTATFVLLALLAKGATVAFYLRERPATLDAVAQ